MALMKSVFCSVTAEVFRRTMTSSYVRGGPYSIPSVENGFIGEVLHLAGDITHCIGAAAC